MPSLEEEEDHESEGEYEDHTKNRETHEVEYSTSEDQCHGHARLQPTKQSQPVRQNTLQ